MNKRILFFLISICCSGNIFANIPCGQYSASGTILRIEKDFFLLVNEKSASEYKLKILEKDIPKIVPYLDKTLKANITISNEMNGYYGNISNIQDLERIIITPMGSEIINHLVLKSKSECGK